MSSGAVVGTISTTTFAPCWVSIASSLPESAAACAAVSVPVWSMTRALDGGTGSTSCATAHPASSANAANSPARRPVKTERIENIEVAAPLRSLRGRLVETHRRRHRDLRLVLHREGRLDLVA